MKKYFLYIIVAVLILGTAGYFLLWGSKENDLKYRTEKVSRGDITVQVRATGTINPMRTVQVGSQVSGIIEKIYVDYNSQVARGQVIAQIDSTFLYASVKEALANLERNQAQVNEAERSHKRTSELFKKDLVSQADLDAAQTAYESAVAQLKQTQAALDRAKVNLRYAIIRAPIDGVVISRDVDVGQTVAASLQTPKLFSIANDLQHMQVEASVDEADIGQIKTGQQVTFTVDAYPEEQFRGQVAQVRLAPVMVQNVVTYTVIIDVPNPDMKLRPGMTATVSIMIDKRENALRIPTLALRFQPADEASDKSQVRAQQADSPQVERRSDRRQQGEGGEMRRSTGEGRGYPGMRPGGDEQKGMKQKVAKVWIIDQKKNLKPVNITTGLNDNRFIEVTTGEIKEGDEIIIGALSSDVASGSSSAQNPFAPRPMMGGGPGRGGR